MKMLTKNERILLTALVGLGIGLTSITVEAVTRLHRKRKIYEKAAKVYNETKDLYITLIDTRTKINKLYDEYESEIDWESELQNLLNNNNGES